MRSSLSRGIWSFVRSNATVSGCMRVVSILSVSLRRLSDYNLLRLPDTNIRKGPSFWAVLSGSSETLKKLISLVVLRELVRWP